MHDIAQNPFNIGKPAMALIAIRQQRDEAHISFVSRKIDTTYSHTVKVIDELEDAEYIQSSKEGRKRILDLTEKGKDTADSFIQVINSIREQPLPA